MLAIYFPALVWSALTIIQQGKKIVASQTMMSVITDKMDNLTKAVENLSRRFDLFLKSELDTLKDIANSVKK